MINQVEKLIQIKDTGIEGQQFKLATLLIWATYLCRNEMAFCEGEDQYGRRFHPATRIRDIQVLKRKVEKMPAFRPGIKDTTNESEYNIRLGDRVLKERIKRDDNNSDDESEESEENEEDELIDFDDFDQLSDLFDFNDLSKKYVKHETRKRQILKEQRNQIRQMLSELDLQDAFDKTIGLMSEEENIENVEEGNEENEADEEPDLYDELKMNFNRTGKQLNKVLPLEYFRKTAARTLNNAFIGHMTLIKTLAILNIVIRKQNLNIFPSDLIRWINEDHIPYKFSALCFPKEWKLMSNDLRTFSCNCLPIAKTINSLTSKIGHFVKVESFPFPDFDKLIKRFLIDLNLPEQIAQIVEEQINLKTYYQNKYKDYLTDDKMSLKSTMHKLPNFDGHALMAIVIVLRIIFGFNGKQEYVMCDSLNEEEHERIFCWKEWEEYAKTRINLIKSYYIPLFGE